VPQHLRRDLRGDLRGDVPGDLPRDVPGDLRVDVRLRAHRLADVPEHPLLHLPLRVPDPVTRHDPDGDERSAADVAVVVGEVGRRLTHAPTLARAVSLSSRQTGYPEAFRWWAPSVAQGHAGLAVLYGALDATYPEQGWDRVGHLHLATAAHAAASAPVLPPSLFSGSAGLGFAALCLARDGRRYARLLDAVDDVVGRWVRVLSSRLTDGSAGRPVRDFDLVSGLTGVGVYLLARDSERSRSLMPGVLAALAGLVVQERQPPAWHTPVEHLEPPEQRELYPNGNLNCGLAHGLPGPLALLSLAALEGHRTALGDAAIERSARWLASCHTVDEWGVRWPDAVPVGETPRPPTSPRSRTTWCYGAPGIARALWLAGQALDDARLRSFSVHALVDAVSRPVAARGLSSVTYCHGTAGLLHVVSAFARDTELPVFRAAAGALVDEVLGHYRPESLLGYVSTEPDQRRVDHPGLLDGAPGVALALMAAVSTDQPRWGRMFLVS
jgi:hypothetical protein